MESATQPETATAAAGNGAATAEEPQQAETFRRPPARSTAR